MRNDRVNILILCQGKPLTKIETRKFQMYFSWFMEENENQMEEYLYLLSLYASPQNELCTTFNFKSQKGLDTFFEKCENLKAS